MKLNITWLNALLHSILKLNLRCLETCEHTEDLPAADYRLSEALASKLETLHRDNPILHLQLRNQLNAHEPDCILHKCWPWTMSPQQSISLMNGSCAIAANAMTANGLEAVGQQLDQRVRHAQTVSADTSRGWLDVGMPMQ